MPVGVTEEVSGLPIVKVEDELIEHLKRARVNILIAETGSGKSTQVPKFLMKWNLEGKKMIAITQPRRIAATSLARRVSSEIASQVGKDIGYAVRFDENYCSSTKIKYMTDGMLLRELLMDPMLNKYSWIIIDEAHERTLITDVIIGSLKSILQKRNDLHLIIMSATLHSKKLLTFFPSSKAYYVEGRQYPVEIFHTKIPQEDYCDSALRTIFQIHISEGPGDVLVFLPGQEDIENLESLVLEFSNSIPHGKLKIIVRTLYANLPFDQQQEVFWNTPTGYRKVILATNIAETSLTINGVKYVVDCGLMKIKQYHESLRMESLEVSPISQSSAKQRAGRAGREGPGKCFRLYTEEDFTRLQVDTLPEIQRMNMSNVILMLLKSGIKNIMEFEYLDPPPRSSESRALEELILLGAMNRNMQITSIGQKMALFPLSPSLARTLWAAYDNFNCLKEVIDIVSCLSTEGIFVSPSSKRDEASEAHDGFVNSFGDHFTILNCFNDYKNILKENNPKEASQWCKSRFVNYRAVSLAIQIQKQLIQYCGRFGMVVNSKQTIDIEGITKAFLVGGLDKVAIMRENGYHNMISHKKVYIHPSSVIFGRRNDCIMYFESIFTVKPYVRTVSKVKIEWLHEIVSEFSKSRIEPLQDQS